ncbi:MAG: exodeoxyribonuclease VII large subunit [Prosthecobacter sp.]
MRSTSPLPISSPTAEAPHAECRSELLAPDAAELRRHFESILRTLNARVSTRLDHHLHVIDLTAKGPLFHAPERLLQEVEQGTDEIETRLRDALRERLQLLTDELTQKQHILGLHHPRVQLGEVSHRAESLAQQLRQGGAHRLDRITDRLKSRGELLKHIGPDSVLSRGFSYTTDSSGRVLKDANEVCEGEELNTRLAKGTVRSVVKAGEK